MAIRADRLYGAGLELELPPPTRGEVTGVYGSSMRRSLLSPKLPRAAFQGLLLPRNGRIRGQYLASIRTMKLRGSPYHACAFGEFCERK